MLPSMSRRKAASGERCICVIILLTVLPLLLVDDLNADTDDGEDDMPPGLLLLRCLNGQDMVDGGKY